ncbi:MAG: hypothetical protein WAK01_09690, partial [Methylocystis sp.]
MIRAPRRAASLAGGARARLEGKLLQICIAAAVATAVAVPLAAWSQAVQDRVVPGSRSEAMLSFAPIVKKAQPAVVNVFASRVEKRPANPLYNDPIFRQFFGEGGMPGRQMAQSLGSGVIVDPS